MESSVDSSVPENDLFRAAISRDFEILKGEIDSAVGDVAESGFVDRSVASNRRHAGCRLIFSEMTDSPSKKNTSALISASEMTSNDDNFFSENKSPTPSRILATISMNPETWNFSVKIQLTPGFPEVAPLVVVTPTEKRSAPRDGEAGPETLWKTLQTDVTEFVAGLTTGSNSKGLRYDNFSLLTKVFDFVSRKIESATPTAESVEKRGARGKKERKKIKEKVEDGESSRSKKPSMKTSADVINRCIWDEKIDTSRITIGYTDRFAGLVERPFDAFSWPEHLCDAEAADLAIPQHRVERVRLDGVVVWDRKGRKDDVFGSTGGRRIEEVLEELERKKMEEEEQERKEEMGREGKAEEEGMSDLGNLESSTTLSFPKFEISLRPYSSQREAWPAAGCHILAHFDEEFVFVYQAFKPSIADWAVNHQRFGGPDYSFARMSWIKTNFLWMMYRSGWATKRDQEHVLAIRVRRRGFDEVLRLATSARRQREENLKKVEVRLQWDPDHDLFGEKSTRRAIQLGLRGAALRRFNDDAIDAIVDVTPFVATQRRRLEEEKVEDVVTPLEKVMEVEEEVRRRLEMDE